MHRKRPLPPSSGAPAASLPAKSTARSTAASKAAAVPGPPAPPGRSRIRGALTSAKIVRRGGAHRPMPIRVACSCACACCLQLRLPSGPRDAPTAHAFCLRFLSGSVICVVAGALIAMADDAMQVGIPVNMNAARQEAVAEAVPWQSAFAMDSPFPAGPEASPSGGASTCYCTIISE